MNVAIQVIEVFGGLALFLYGIEMLSAGMEEVAGTSIQTWLERMTNHPLKAATFGLVATAILQSSSLLMVTMIGLINANLLTLQQAIGVMMGQEIGTTLTGQIVAFNIGNYIFVLVVLGYFINTFAEGKSYQPLGKALLGVGIIFLALDTMKLGVAPLTELPLVRGWLIAMGQAPLLGILAGAAFTAILQSSSATTTLAIALGTTNAITLPGAIGIILGANLGTCVTGWIASLRSSRAARQASVAQILINVIGVALFVPFIAPFARMVSTTAGNLPRQIANAHSVFNIASSILLFPFIGVLKSAAERLVPDSGRDETKITRFIDDHLLNVPSIALQQAANELVRTATITGDMLDWSRAALIDLDEASIQKVMDYEQNQVDILCAVIDRFLNRVLRGHVNEKERRRCFQLKYLVTDVERVADMAENLAEAGQERINEKIPFSPDGVADLTRFHEATVRVWRMAVKSLETGDEDLARQVELAEDDLDVLHGEVREGHAQRLEQGVCQHRADILFIETLRNLERIGDHADNLALGVLQAESPSLRRLLGPERAAQDVAWP